MMNCAKCQRLYMLHLDGSLPKDEENEMSSHLNQCFPCQKETQKIDKICTVIKEREIYPSENVLEQIKRKAGEQLSIKQNKIVVFPFRIPPFALPRLAYSFITIGVMFLLISVFLSIKSNKHFHQIASYDKKKLDVSLAPKKTRYAVKDIDKYFEDIYAAEVKRNIQQTFSVIDREVSSTDKYSDIQYFSLIPAVKTKTIEDSLNDLEERIELMFYL